MTSMERLVNFLSENPEYRSHNPIKYRVMTDDGEDLILAFKDMTSRGETPDYDEDCQVLIGGTRVC
jgi:hypothetical protein